MKYRKIFLALICAPLLLGVVSCSSPSDNNFKIVSTVFPQYDWTKNIIEGAENVTLNMLINTGVDLHSYQPSVKDINTIRNSDLLIYVGGESDEWVDDVINSSDKQLNTINLMDVLGDAKIEEELKEGMEGHDEEEHDHEEEVEYDEHVWLSVKNTAIFSNFIASKLKELNSENASVYETNVASYVTELTALDQKYEAALKDTRTNTLLFGDRFPFRYLVEDYDLDYYAAFIGCSAESEASFETISFLVNKVNELDIRVILTLEGSSKQIANTIKQNSNSKDQRILEVNSLQSITKNDVDKGKNYISIMDANLDVFTEALA